MPRYALCDIGYERNPINGKLRQTNGLPWSLVPDFPLQGTKRQQFWPIVQDTWNGAPLPMLWRDPFNGGIAHSQTLPSGDVFIRPYLVSPEPVSNGLYSFWLKWFDLREATPEENPDFHEIKLFMRQSFVRTYRPLTGGKIQWHQPFFREKLFQSTSSGGATNHNRLWSPKRDTLIDDFSFCAGIAELPLVDFAYDIVKEPTDGPVQWTGPWPLPPRPSWVDEVLFP